MDRKKVGEKYHLVPIKYILAFLCCCLLAIAFSFCVNTSYNLGISYNTLSMSYYVYTPDPKQLYNVDPNDLFTFGGQLSVISTVSNTLLSLEPSLVNTQLTTDSLWNVNNINMATLSSTEIYCQGVIFTNDNVTMQVDPSVPQYNLPPATSLVSNTLSAITWSGSGSTLTFGPPLKGLSPSVYGILAGNADLAQGNQDPSSGLYQIWTRISHSGRTTGVGIGKNVTFPIQALGGVNYYTSMNLSQIGNYVVRFTIQPSSNTIDASLYLNTTTTPIILQSTIYLGGNSTGTRCKEFIFQMGEFERGNLNIIGQSGPTLATTFKLEVVSLF